VALLILVGLKLIFHFCSEIILILIGAVWSFRSLNDDWIAAGIGFGTHSHKNMEIITTPLEGSLIQKMSNKDAMGITNCNQIEIITNLKLRILLIEVPMKN